ncbi:nucleotide exchange factor GrpE [Lactococcus lactis]|uniref:nucleotide exchange factor GrpE n=1 Tax=Lactococcus lactis TaxID=1358 RepID=UPI00288CB257|nr:nucleotide exchange factor GrpE [Lactococcus lactis]MDT2893253.1 nucleotide exchange factor GrpE [Lactococcus lactis]MDT2914765.1 nucleotide exchange factor GrpE [Lactococcus lactis]
MSNLHEESLCDNLINLEKEMIKNSEDLSYLKDLFARRLFEDKQKQGLIDNLDNLSKNAIMKPFLLEIILVLDRLENSDNEFIQSIYEEIFDIFSIRGLEKIVVEKEFNSKFARVVKKKESSGVTQISIVEVVRNGYKFHDQVIRPTEVVVEVPKK